MNLRRSRSQRAARVLDRIAPGVAAVLITPVYMEDLPRGPRIATHVFLVDAAGLPLQASADVHRGAYRLLRRIFPAADWTREHRYDVRACTLRRQNAPQLPPGLGGAQW
ncbi:hypothetical protein ACGF4C_30405 [Streptomyces sp. NPDC048197]|uniref:hypothetical protein n=1 Tax=Streptomyces sp. NPDC048197 TaxID=3365511 RepID=UPI00371068C4